MRLDAIKLQNQINRMEDLYSQIIDDLFSDSGVNLEVVDEYKSIKKDILLSLYNEPVHNTEDKYFPNVREALQRLTLDGDPFLPANITTENDNVRQFHNDFNKLLDVDLSDELKQLASDEFYSWFSGEEYIQDKIKGQLLILQSERLPEYLTDYVNEIRECFTFQRYIAAFVLCRTVFEIAIRDLTHKNQLLKENSKHWNLVKDFIANQLEKNNRSLEKYLPTLEVYIELLSCIPSFQQYKNEMHELRAQGNSVIHANKIVGRTECQKMVRDTFWLTHKLYEVN